MPKKPAKPGIPKSADIPDDAFVAFVERVTVWAQENTRAVVFGAVTLAIIVAGTLYYVNYQRTLENEAAARFTELQGTLMTGNVPMAIRDLQTFVNRFGGTAAGDQARLILADVLMGHGRHQEALDALGNLPRDVDKPLGSAAARLQAAALEGAGQHDDAVRIYQRLAERARFPFQRREALADAARVRLQTGDPQAAAELYQLLVDTFDPAEPTRGYYEMWLAEARAQARGDGPAAAPVPVPDEPVQDVDG